MGTPQYSEIYEFNLSLLINETVYLLSLQAWCNSFLLIDNANGYCARASLWCSIKFNGLMEN